MKKYMIFTLATCALLSCNKVIYINQEDDKKTTSLPKMLDPDDVCTSMDDLNFMKYCYENFDVNKDGKVSLS